METYTERAKTLSSNPASRQCVSAAADFGTPAYEKMVKTCIKQDLTWKEPAKKWEALLEELAFGTEESAKKAEVIEPEKLASGIAATTA